jgi:hypothetical protein
VTLFTGVASGKCMGEKALASRVGIDCDGDGKGVEEKENENENENEKQHAHQSTEGRLQVAVLLQMLSPNRPEVHNKINKDALECSVGVSWPSGLW